MPLDKAKTDELKEVIAMGRKRSLAYGLCLGKKPEGTVLVTHKTKAPKVLGQQAKNEGETGHFTFGTLSVKGKEFNMIVEGKMPSGIARKLKMMLKSAGLAMKVVILDPAGNSLETDGDEDDAPEADVAEPEIVDEEPAEQIEDAPSDETEEASAPIETPDAPDDGQAKLVAKWEATMPKIDSTLAKFADKGGIDMSEIDGMWERLQVAAAAGDYKTALTGIPKLTELLKSTAASAAKQDAQVAVMRKKWEGAQSKLGAHIEDIAASGHKSAKKINAIWGVATAKAEASPPDFPAALKAVGMLAQLISEARKDMATTAAPAETTVAADGDGDTDTSTRPAAPGATDASAPPPDTNSAPSDGPSSAASPQPEAPEQESDAPAADLSGSVIEKIARIETTAASTKTGPIKTYNELIGEAISATPADWARALDGATGAASTAKADPAKADESKLDAALKDLAALDGTIKTATTAKTAFKKALEVHDLRFVPLSSHPKFGAPEIAVDIRAITDGRAAALVKSQAHDNANAAKDLEPLAALIAAAEILADDLAHFEAIDPARKAQVDLYRGTNNGIPAVDNLQREIERLYADAQTDKAARKFKDGIAKLDQIPAKFVRAELLFKRKDKYDKFLTNDKPRIDTINGKAEPLRRPVQGSIDEVNTDFAAGLIATTGDYEISWNKWSNLWRIITFLETELKAIEDYQAAQTAFETKLAEFKTHAGADGIAAEILAMEQDLDSAKAESASKKNVTALAILNRSKPAWATTLTAAADYKAYVDKRDAVKLKVDALAARPEAAATLQQAIDLMSVAATQSLNKAYPTALATVTEADTRADAAKLAADAQDEMGALHDENALDALQTDWVGAYKVFTDMRAKAASADTTNSFATLLARADVPAGEAVKSKDAASFDDARAYLDNAISNVRIAQVIILAHAPFVAHLAQAKAGISAVPTATVDNKLRAQIDAANALVTEAEDLAKAEGYDYPAAEAKLTDADKIVDQANANAALYPAIKADLATAGLAIAAVNGAPAAVSAQMAHRITEVQAMIDATNTLLDGGDFKGAGAKAKTAAGWHPQTVIDVADVQLCLSRKVSWHDNWLPQITGPAAAAGATAYVKVQAKLAAHTAQMTAHNYKLALNLLGEVSWAVVACDKIIKAAATYAPVKTAADTALNPLKAARNARVETDVVALETKYNAALAHVGNDAYGQAQKLMAEIPAPAQALLVIAQGWAAYEPSRSAADTKLTEAEGHADADAISVQITRLRGKYANAVGYADAGDFATAKTMMDEITTTAADAISTADNHALVEKVNGMIGGDEDSAPWWPQIQAAKGSIKVTELRDSTGVAKSLTDTAWAEIARSEKKGDDSKEALLAALAACNRADEILSQHSFILQAIENAKLQVTAIESMPNGAYVAPEIADLRKRLDAAQTAAATGQGFDRIATELDAIMTDVHTTKAMPPLHTEYTTLRTSQEVEPRLAVLEAHNHRYAVKPDIDAMRAKLVAAGTKESERDLNAAIALLKEARTHGTNAFVLAQMRANTPPSEAEIKEILARTGGDAELDAMIDALEPEARRSVVKVVFAARFDCKIENFTNANFAPAGVVADGTTAGPNVVAFYQAMEGLPNDDTLNNDSMANFSIADSGSGSAYAGDTKTILMAEGDAAYSTAYNFGSEHEVGSPDDATTDEERQELENCQPANDDPVTFFNWNTLHEVGHAVDDKHGYMDKNGSGARYGGWTAYGRNVAPVAAALNVKFDYDEAYIIACLTHTANPPIPEKPSGQACSDEEWERRRLAVRAHVAMASVGTKPWSSMSIAQKLAVNGVVYQESYANSWYSYQLAERSKAITGYQFRAPGEWFSELYAAYHSQKLKPTHPAVAWLETL